MGSCWLICWAYCEPISTSCCVETPQPVNDTASTTPETKRFIGSLTKKSEAYCARPIPLTRDSNILKLLTLARDLRRRKSREHQHLFTAEGVRAVEELLRSPLTVRGALVAPHLVHDARAELDAFRRRHEMPLWGADAGGAPLDASRTPARLALAVGNEGAGLSQDARQRADLLVALPIEGGVESLNVAVATGILLYQLRS